MNRLYTELAQAVAGMDETAAERLAEEIVRQGLPVSEALEKGLEAGMEEAGRLFENEEYFITELLLCADAMDAAMKVFTPLLKTSGKPAKGRIVIGTIFGDTHDIGKNIVALMLTGAGFDVLDLGRDVSAERFADEAVRFDADIITVSTLMTTTMNNIRAVIDVLCRRGLRDRFRVIIGGKPCSKNFADKIGADDYSASAPAALRLVKRIMREKYAE